MIEFRRLMMHNFMSYRGTQVVPLSKQGIVRIEGRNLDENADSNMAGKSTIIEALVWCLYGRTIRGLKHDGVVNRFVRNNCFVHAVFHIAGKTYSVRRYRKHKKQGNRLRVWAQGSLISHRHEAETQSRLESLLGCDLQAFSNSVVFGGVRAFASMSDAEQKKILESFLHFDKFDAALKRTKDGIAESQENLASIRVEVEKERGEANRLRERLDTLRESETIFLEKARKEVRKARAALDELSKPEKISLEEVNAAEEKLERRISKLSAAKEKSRELKHRLRGLTERVNNRRKMIGKPCPACGQDVSDDSLSSLLKHIRRDRLILVENRCELLRTIGKLETRTEYGRRRLKRLRKLQAGMIAYIDRREELEGRYRNCTSEYRKLLSSSSSLSIRAAKTSIQYSRAVSRMLVSVRKISMLEGHIKDLEFWETGFGNKGIKSLIIREALPSLNSKLKEYTDRIFGGSAELLFVPTKETQSGGERELFNVRYSARRGGSSYLSESTGGRRRVDICILLVFSWLSRTSNLLLIDELLDGLDETGRNTVLDILSTLRGTILTITHKKDLKSQIGKVWTITKKNGVSRLETAA